MSGWKEPPLSVLSRQGRALPLVGGQLRLGLKEEIRQEALLEEVSAFVTGLFSYGVSRVRGFCASLWGTLASGFTFTSELKLFVQRKLYRRKGQLAFPLAHASLLGVSFSLLFFASGFGELLYQRAGMLDLSKGAAIVIDRMPVATEESELLRTEVQIYTVQSGDTLYDIAERFRVSVDALAYANDISNLEDILRIGTELTVPPVEGLIYTVRKGDTVEKIADKYKASAQSIVEFNYLFPPYELAVGTELIVPNAQIPKTTPEPVYVAAGGYSSGGFLSTASGACGPLSLRSLSWPTSTRNITQYFWWGHRAIDIGVNYQPLYAVADGVVTGVGYHGVCRSFSRYCNYGYGGYIFIDIGGGYQVRYGHISEARVGVGEKVSRGQVIGISGESGMAFGPHLHFELWCGGTKINPLPYLH